jgi:hypothetical protein
LKTLANWKFINLKKCKYAGYHFRSRTYDWFLRDSGGDDSGFHKMATAGGQIEVGALSEGIYTAMTTTVVGLVVGIIAYVGYNHLVVRQTKLFTNGSQCS